MDFLFSKIDTIVYVSKRQSKKGGSSYMTATLVLEPTEEGWNIVNYDDFRNSMSAFIDRSFIPYPSEESGITDEQAINDFAENLGASGWTTTLELENDAHILSSRGFLENEEPILKRKSNNKRNFQMKESSKKVATNYSFWDKDDSDPTFITGQYGIPGDYTNSRQWNVIQIDDGRWDVSVVGADGFPKEVGLYETISEAGSALLQYLNENGITASFNKEGRMSASVRKSYIGSFWGDTLDDGFGDYEYFYGEPDEENNSIMLFGEPKPNGVKCEVASPAGDKLDSFFADSWEDAKDKFDTDCRINHLYDNYIEDPQNPFTNKEYDDDDYYTASVVKATGPFRLWYALDGGYFYGIEGNIYKSVELNIIYGDEEDGIEPYAEILAPNGDEVTSTTFRPNATEDEIKKWFEDFCTYYIYMPDYIDMSDIVETASKKVSSENCVWNKMEVGDGYSFNFGPKDDYLKGLTVEVDEEGDDGYEYIVYGSDGDIIINEDGYSTADAALKEAIAWCEDNPENVTASVKTSMDEDSNGYSFWGEEPTEDGGFSVWYGEFQEPKNSLPIDVEYYNASSLSYDPDDPGYFTIGLHTSTEWDAEDISSEISDVSQDTLDEVWEELKEDLPLIAPDYLIPVKEFDEMKMNGDIATASVKVSKITNSNGYEFDDSQWDAIVNLMDDELREKVASELDDPTEQEFFDAYAKAYEDKFGEEWELDKANPTW